MPLILNRFRVCARSLSPVASGFTTKVNYADFSTKGRKNNNESSEASRASNGPQYTLPDFADVVVIGGGSIGCSTLYHLAKLNAGKVVLVEKDKLTSGTTWHTGGLFFHLRNDNEVHIRMQLHTHDLLSRILPEEAGQDSGWLETGLITITRRKQQLEELEKRFMLGTQLGVESSIIGPTEIGKLHPLLDTQGLAGGLYVPKDGSIDATALCNAYVKVATKYGAEVHEGCEVKGIHTTEGITGQKRVSSIETNLGRINTNCVVNCTGVWASYIAEMVGLHVPQVTYVHTNVVTEGLPGIKNTPHIKDVEGSCYLKRQGDALLIGGDDIEPAAIEKIEKDFAFSLYDVDWERAGRLIGAASSLIPEVAKVGITSTVCGPEAYNMDGNPIMGESPSIRGFFHACGFSGGGMMLGGGAGQQLAHWIVHGSPEYDLSCCDINRFSSKLIRHRPWVLETTHEHFTQRYSVHHPNLKNLSGRGLRKSPLHGFHLENGAFFTCVHGWEVPEYFKPGKEFPLLEYDYKGSYGHKIHKEYEYRDQMLKECDFEFQQDIDELVKSEALSTTRAALFDLSHLSKFCLHGKFAEEAVQVLFPEDLTYLGKNQSKFSMMLGNDGTIVSQVILTKENESKYNVIASAQQQEFVLRHAAFCLDDLKISCKFEDVTETFALLHLQGDGSSKVLQTIFPNVSNLDKICCTKVSISGRDVSISKCPLSGYNILCDVDDAMAVHQALISSNPRPTIAGTRALKSLSMEAGQDFLLDAGPAGLDPREADLTHMCCFDDTRQYIGKNALLQRLEQPLTFKLISLTADTKDPIFPGDVIWRDGIYFGMIKDASYGYNRNKFFIQG